MCLMLRCSAIKVVTSLYYIQVTTHSHLLSRDELDHIGRNLFSDPSHVHAFSLQEFDTELDFSNKVGYVYHDNQNTTNFQWR